MTFVDPAGVNDPVLIASAVVIFVPGSCCRARLAHDSADGVCGNAAVWTIIRIALADPTIPDRDLITRAPVPAQTHESLLHDARRAHAMSLDSKLAKMMIEVTILEDIPVPRRHAAETRVNHAELLWRCRGEALN